MKKVLAMMLVFVMVFSLAAAAFAAAPSKPNTAKPDSGLTTKTEWVQCPKCKKPGCVKTTTIAKGVVDCSTIRWECYECGYRGSKCVGLSGSGTTIGWTPDAGYDWTW